MTAVRRRLRTLVTLELLNIPLFGWVFLILPDRPTTPPDLVGFTMFALLLIQGAAYWAAKLRQTGRPLTGGSLPGRSLPGRAFFRAARLINPALLLTALAFTLGTRSWLGAGFTVFAILEHVNYFHTQLMHDTRADLRRLRTHGLRRSHLARDLAPRR